MKAIKIYTQDSKYFMEDLHTNTTVELTNPRFDKGSGKNWFDLPENSIGQKAICKEMIDLKGEVTKAERAEKTINSPKTHKSTKINLDQYYTDEERAKIEKLNEQIDKINEAVMERAKFEIKKNELKETLKSLDHDTLKAIMNEIM